MKKNFVEFLTEFKEDFNKTAIPKIDEILTIENKTLRHNKLVTLRLEYIIKFTTDYLHTEWNNPFGYITPSKLDFHAEALVDGLLNECLDNRKKTFEI